MNALLTDKNAIIYGGGGSIGAATAKAFAREGATVHLVGRTAESLEQVAAEIEANGGAARTAVLDANDEQAVNDHAAAVGRIDISFNLVQRPDKQGTPLIDMPLDDYLEAIDFGSRTTF